MMPLSKYFPRVSKTRNFTFKQACNIVVKKLDLYTQENILGITQSTNDGAKERRLDLCSIYHLEITTISHCSCEHLCIQRGNIKVFITCTFINTECTKDRFAISHHILKGLFKLLNLFHVAQITTFLFIYFSEIEIKTQG